MKNIFFDFIIIGSGLSGLYAAFYASRHGTVAVISKSDLKTSSSYLAQGGIAAAVGKDDSTKIHFTDTIKVAKGIGNISATQLLVEEGKKEIENLISEGMPFDKKDGALDLGLEGGHSQRRIIHANGSSTGREVTKFLFELIKNNSNITFFENHFAFELLSNDSSVNGVKIFDQGNNSTSIFYSNRIIIATGGASGIYQRTTNPETSTGDGIALAFNAGAEIENMEFVQFHPTSLALSSTSSFLLSEALRGEGALIVDASENRILEGSDKTELSPRDELSKIIFDYINSTNNAKVYLKLFHLDKKIILGRFSYIYQELLKLNLDLTKDLIPISPAAHYTVGGIKTGLYGETNINALYAVGEAASSGVHGANRLASNSLLECLVFSKRAIQHSYEASEKTFLSAGESPKQLQSSQRSMKDYFRIKKELSAIMWNFVGIQRSLESLTFAKMKLDQLIDEYSNTEDDINRVKILNLIQVCSLTTIGAIKREESRGCHFRKDFPFENPDFRVNIIQTKNSAVRFQPIDEINYEI